MTIRYTNMYLENNPYYSYTTTLEGVSYTITVRYSTRSKAWYLDVTTRDNIIVLAGIKLVPNFPILSNIVIPQLTGNFLLFPLQPANRSKLDTNPELIADYFGLVYYYNK